jgi:hypothetical protein
VTIEPRPWITLADLTAESGDNVLCPLPDGVTDDAAEAAIALATAVLYERTGRRWSGTAVASVRPAAQDSAALAKVPGWVPSWGTFNSDKGESCVESDRIELGYYPVLAVPQVRIGGVVLAPSAYQVQDRRTLVRLDGGVWPCDQDLVVPPTQPDTFEVTVLHGIPAPEAGRVACAVYAVELAKAFCGLDCQLPQRTQYVTRQGVSAILADPLNFVERGMIGLPLVDSWIRSVNPQGRRKRAMMVSQRNVTADSKQDDCTPGYRSPFCDGLAVDYYAYPYRNINRF